MHIVPTTVSQVFIKTDKKKKKMVSSNTSRYFNFNKETKFCPLCSFVFEGKIQYIKSKHYKQVKVPKLTSASEINNKILSFTRNKIMVPLYRIINIMGIYWSNPEIRNVGYKLCNLGQVTTYGGLWYLDNVTDVPNIFEQYIIKFEKDKKDEYLGH